jgi:hypothetical protein
VRRVHVDFLEVLALSERFDAVVVGALMPMDPRAALLAGLRAGGMDDEHATDASNAALWRWATVEGACSDQTRAAAREAVGLIEEAESITRSMPPVVDVPTALRGRPLVKASVHYPTRPSR